MARPTIFIGSSTKGKDIAKAVSFHLEQDANIKIWNEGVFALMEGTLEGLLATVDDFDFAILVASPDDTLIKDGETFKVPRDNVMFELGLFIGHLGLERVFLVAPETERLPSDLAGVTVAHYEQLDPERDLKDATRVACSLIQDAMKAVTRLRIKARDLWGSYKYRCRALNNKDFTHGGVCSLRWNEERKCLGIIGRRMWRAQSERDDKALLYQKVTPFSLWQSNWSSINGDEFRFDYSITIDNDGLMGFAHNDIEFDQEKNVTGFTGNYWILPPGRPEWGTVEFRKIQTTQPSLDYLTYTDILWDAMKLV